MKSLTDETKYDSIISTQTESEVSTMVKMKENEVLQYYRKKAKITQKQMAEMTGYAKNHISAVERGLYKPNGRLLLTYIKECNIPLDAFF